MADAGVAECGPGGEVEELSFPADGLGSFAEHGVVEESVAGFGVVAPPSSTSAVTSLAP